jgi:anaerobic magnesium-protoporphyrin IX monomethyl ester cyclase
VRTVLLYPPLLDPTAPYHSLSYLKAAAVERGHRDTVIIDANIGAIRHVLAPGFVASTMTERQARREQLRAALARHTVAGLDPREAAELAELCKLDLIDPEELQDAVGVLRDPGQFYDLGRYWWAVDRIVAWMSVLATTGVPGQFHQGFRLSLRGIDLSRIADLTDTAGMARISRPFDPYVREILLPRLRKHQPDVVGLNLTFASQLPFSLHLLALLRAELPDTHLIVGGTEVSDVYKYLTDKAGFFRVFADADSAVVGEGESAFVSLLDRLSGVDGTVPLPAVRLHPDRAPAGWRPRPLALHHENLRRVPAPDFSDIDFDQYLSPHR